jgi:hypothetical protein
MVAINGQIIDKMQVSLMLHNNEKVYLRFAPQPHEQTLQRCLGVKPLPPILAEKLLINYL